MNENLKLALDEIGSDIVADITKQLLDLDKNATGNLIKSIDYKVIDAANSVILEISSDNYLKYVDQGRRPGKQPPTAAIIPWVQARGIEFKSKTGNIIPEKSTAFLIARSIGRKGIKPTHILKNTIDKIYKNKENLIAKAAVEDIKDLVDKIIFNK